MTYCKENNLSGSFSKMEAIGRSAFIGYTVGTIMAASATLPRNPMPIHLKSPYISTCSIRSHSELSAFIMTHAEVSFQPIWSDPSEDIWDTL